MTGRGQLWPAAVGVVVWLAALGGFDVWLIRRGYRPVTDVARTPAGRAFRAYTGAHFDQRLGPLDLYSAAGRIITRRNPTP